MKISIIMPIYNAEKQIKKSLGSILNQTYKNIELILVNDGSRDDSLAICKSYKENNPFIKLIDIKNSGPALARNIGLGKVSGDYICFVDADDALENTFLEKMVKILREGDYDIVAANHFIVDREIKEAKNSYTSGAVGRFGTKEEKERYNLFKTSSSFGYVWGKLYKTSFIKENSISFNREKKVFLEDTLFNLKAIAYKPRYFVLNEPLCYYNVYEDSVSNKKEDITEKSIKMLEDYETFLDEKGVWSENIDLFVPLTARVIAWSLFKTMEDNFKIKNIYSKAACFSSNKTIRRVLLDKASKNQIKKLKSRAQRALYLFIITAIKYRLNRLLTLFFYINYPIFSIYIKRAVKA